MNGANRVLLDIFVAIFYQINSKKQTHTKSSNNNSIQITQIIEIMCDIAALQT